MNNFLTTLIAVAVAQDIVGAIPIYLNMTRSLSMDERKKMLNTCILVAFSIALAFSLAGNSILYGLGINILDLKIAGGILLLIIAIIDLTGQPHSEIPVTGSAGIIPLAFPIIAGPATLTTVIAHVNSSGYVTTLLALTVNYVFAWVVLKKSAIISKTIGRDGIMILSKIAALLMAAIGVAMIKGGVIGAMHGA